MRKSLRNCFSILSMCLIVMNSSIADTSSRKAIIERIKPVGTVTIGKTEETPSKEIPVTKAEKNKPLTSKAIYEKHCALCHAQGLAGAPKIGDSKAWQEREDKGMSKMLENVVNGLNAMPAKGTCMNCTKQQLKQAIQFMLTDK